MAFGTLQLHFSAMDTCFGQDSDEEVPVKIGIVHVGVAQVTDLIHAHGALQYWDCKFFGPRFV